MKPIAYKNGSEEQYMCIPHIFDIVNEDCNVRHSLPGKIIHASTTYIKYCSSLLKKQLHVTENNRVRNTRKD